MEDNNLDLGFDVVGSGTSLFEQFHKGQQNPGESTPVEIATNPPGKTEPDPNKPGENTDPKETKAPEETIDGNAILEMAKKK
jgi:hypothetical protein